MKNKSIFISRPKKKTKSGLKKTPAVKAALSGKTKKSAEKTGKNKIGTSDNTRLRKMQRELRETKERLRLLSEAAEEGIAIHHNGVIIDANDALARLFGYELSEMIGMRAERLATPESWKVIRKHISRKYDKPYEAVGIKKDGSTFICSLLGKPHKYKGRAFRLSVFRDITEIKKAEDELRHEEYRFKALIEQSSDIIVFVNREGIVTYENPAVEKLLELKPKDRIGVNIFNRIHPDDLKFANDAFNSFKEHTSFKDINSPVRQIRIRHQDGSWRTFETAASKLLHDNIVEAVIINLRDITERKKAEEALRESESRFRAQYNGNPIPTFTWQKQGNEFILIDFNDSAKIFTTEQRNSFLGRQASEIYKNRREILGCLKKCFDEKRIIRIESISEHFMPGKSVMITFVPVSPDLIMVYLEDISERKRTEKEIQFKGMLLDTAADSILVHDLSGRIVYANNVAEKMRGFQDGTMIGKDMKLFTTHEYARFISERISEIKQKGELTFESYHYRNDGSSFPLEVHALLIDTGEEKLILRIGRDITERKMSEHQINQRLKELQAFFNLAEITEKDGITLEKLYQEIADILPASWQYTEITCCRIVIHDRKFRTKNFSESAWIQSTPIKVHGAVAGKIDIGYLKEMPEDYEGPFMKEERLLLDTIAERLGRITERMRTEESLKETELKFKTIFDYASDGILLLSVSEGKFWAANEKICTMLGYTNEELLNLGIPDIHPKDVVPFVIDQAEKQLKKEILVAENIPVIRKDKTVFFADISSSPLTLGGNEYLLGIFRDITERKRAEEELRLRESYLTAILENQPGLVWLKDKDSRFLTVNQAFADSCGKNSAKELINKTDLDIWPKELAEKYRADDASVIKNMTSIIVEEPIFDRGETKWFETFKTPVIDNNREVIGTTGYARDITDRKRAEEAVKVNHAQMLAIFDAIDEPVYVADTETYEMLYINRATNLAWGDTQNRKCHEYLQHRDTSCPFCTNPKILGEYFGRSYVWEFQNEINKRWYKCIDKAIPWPDGRIVRYEMAVDITERKQVEEELKKYREHLEELVRERTIKLEASNKELEAFSFSASHDLRAPIRTIDGFSQALLEDYKDKLDMQGKNYLIRIRSATSHMIELIDDLLQLSRITRAEMNIEQINLTGIARSVIDELHKSQPERYVETRIADGLEETADSRLMRIVLENLMGNSWKFTGKKAHAVVEFGFMKNGDRKTYFIRDNGVGFDMAYADKLFAPFQRLHTDNEFPGTGIGLATVQRIIHRHEGRIWAEGQINKGATFYFTLNEK